MNRTAAVFGAIALLCVGASAQAGTIVDTGTPPSPSDSGYVDYCLCEGIAARFEITTATSISGIEGFFSGVDMDRTYTIALYGDGADKPGAQLFETAATATSNFNWNGKSGLNWAVNPGFYWAAFEVRAGQTFFTAGMPSPFSNPLQNYAFKSGGTYFGSDGLSTGLRVFDNPGGGGGPAIPEPSTWALMIGGFGLAGAALRRRRATVAA